MFLPSYSSMRVRSSISRPSSLMSFDSHRQHLHTLHDALVLTRLAGRRYRHPGSRQQWRSSASVARRTQDRNPRHQGCPQREWLSECLSNCWDRRAVHEGDKEALCRCKRSRRKPRPCPYPRCLGATDDQREDTQVSPRRMSPPLDRVDHVPDSRPTRRTCPCRSQTRPPSPS